nr:MAG TPA: hypothetical protein [Caudoviricetes sp.]
MRCGEHYRSRTLAALIEYQDVTKSNARLSLSFHTAK